MITVGRLRCEYKENPLGIDQTQPRLSWVIESAERAQYQSAYQIQAASDPDLLLSGTPDLWDTGKVASSITSHIPYDGKPLISQQAVYWRVRVWDQQDQESDFCSPVFWEMGLLKRTDWQAKWIGTSLVGGPQTTIPCPYIQRNFWLSAQPAKARLYITALGVYEAFLNGIKIGTHILPPGWTDYAKRVQYQVYDVADLLSTGDNAIGLVLGDGWYCGHIGWCERQYYGDRPKIFAQLEVIQGDGTSVFIATDAQWKYNFGPLLESDLLMGESYDARLEFSKWATADNDLSDWPNAVEFNFQEPTLVAQIGTGVKVIQEVNPIAPPRKLEGLSKNTWIFDLGQNMTGVVRLEVKGDRGETVRLRYAEMVNPDGTLYTANLRSARQTDYYTLKGTGDIETYVPKFTYHGFRFVEVSGLSLAPDQSTITGLVLHSDMEETGWFHCSDALINQLAHNIKWGQKGNFLDVPTDCPQRDERLGWTGDAQVFAMTAAYNFDVAAFFTRYQQNLADSQGPRGEFPPYSPFIQLQIQEGGPAWAEAGIICPWTIYQMYGDDEILRAYYPNLKKFMDFQIETSENFIRCFHEYDGFKGFGDWLSINAETPRDLIGTALFAYSAYLMSLIASVLGNIEDERAYQKLFQDIREAFCSRFVSPSGLISGGTQTSYVLALHFDLLPEHLRAGALRELVNDIQNRNFHLSTGFVGAPYLLFVLSRFGRRDIAYQLLNQTSWPSWLYPVTQGATTVWERWDGWTHDKGFQDPGMNSFNHYAYGSVGAWLYSEIGGIIHLPEHPGFREFIIAPKVDCGLQNVLFSFVSQAGKIISKWEMTQTDFVLEVQIPSNTTALVKIPFFGTQDINHDGDGYLQFLYKNTEFCAFRVPGGRYKFVTKHGRSTGGKS